ncbi:hypothetical protein YC2023_124327 [Brassica napus]
MWLLVNNSSPLFFFRKLTLLSLVDSGRNSTKMFLLRYVFQTSVHTIWRERNGKKHVDGQQSSAALIKFFDKRVRNRISSLRKGGSQRFTNALVTLFATRDSR